MVPDNPNLKIPRKPGPAALQLSFWVKAIREHSPDRGCGVTVVSTILEDAVTGETITVRGRVGEIDELIHMAETRRDNTLAKPNPKLTDAGGKS